MLPTVPARSDPRETVRLTDLLRQESVGGVLLLVAALAAVIWANTPWRDAYETVQNVHVGPAFIGLHLSIAHWASDALLAVFFFVVGLELMHELRRGSLRDPAKAAVPVVAAACGVAVPAAVYAVVQVVGDGDLAGWAIPTATDIAFALAVLAVISSHLPSALRAFLLTLAVVDDLIAIVIIAVFYSSELHLALLAAALLPLLVFAVLLRTTWHPWWVLVPLAAVAWVLVLRSGIHATIAGVLLGLVVPTAPDGHTETSLGQRFDHVLRPVSAGVCVPLFAFFSAGVTVVGGGLTAALRDPVTIGVVLGLVVGKTVGVFGGTFLTARLTRAQLDAELTWGDLFGVSLLGGVGFTVSLLVGELAFGAGSPADDHARLGILLGSVIAAILASAMLGRRNAAYRRIAAEDARRRREDETRDGTTRPREAT